MSADVPMWEVALLSSDKRTRKVGRLSGNVPKQSYSLNQLSFRLEDVKVLINSHAHFDHAGGFAQLKKLTGAKLMISEADAKLILDGGRSDFQWRDNSSFHFEPAEVDHLLRDEDKVQLGGVTMMARITPGHIKGCTT